MSDVRRLIVFDWGGVILRICRSWREGCERAGLAYEPELDTPEIAERRHRIARRYEIGSLDADGFLGAVAETMDNRYSPDDIRRVHLAWLIEEYPGADDLLSELADIAGRGRIETGLLSNTNHLHWIEHLHPDEGGTGAFPAVRKLRHRHASHLLKLAKPDARIFEVFEAGTGFGPTQIVYFDDLEANVLAARQRGWDAVHIDHTGDTVRQVRTALAARGVPISL